MRRAVDVGLKLDAVFAELSKPGQAKYLKPSAVGQDRPIPRHESMKPTQLIDRRVARSQIEVIGVAENYRRSSFLEHPFGEPLYGTLRNHRDENRRVDWTVRGLDAPGARERL